MDTPSSSNRSDRTRAVRSAAQDYMAGLRAARAAAHAAKTRSRQNTNSEPTGMATPDPGDQSGSINGVDNLAPAPVAEASGQSNAPSKAGKAPQNTSVHSRARPAQPARKTGVTAQTRKARSRKSAKSAAAGKAGVVARHVHEETKLNIGNEHARQQALKTLQGLAAGAEQAPALLSETQPAEPSSAAIDPEIQAAAKEPKPSLAKKPRTKTGTRQSSKPGRTKATTKKSAAKEPLAKITQTPAKKAAETTPERKKASMGTSAQQRARQSEAAATIARARSAAQAAPIQTKASGTVKRQEEDTGMAIESSAELSDTAGVDIEVAAQDLLGGQDAPARPQNILASDKAQSRANAREQKAETNRAARLASRQAVSKATSDARASARAAQEKIKAARLAQKTAARQQREAVLAARMKQAEARKTAATQTDRSRAKSKPLTSPAKTATQPTASEERGQPRRRWTPSRVSRVAKGGDVPQKSTPSTFTSTAPVGGNVSASKGGPSVARSQSVWSKTKSARSNLVDTGLTALPGIGEAMARRLAQAGISNVADLLASDPGSVRERLGPVSKLANVESWYAHAERLSCQP